MRISDWSSDVCSADLRQIDAGAGTRVDRQRPSDAQLVDLAEAFVGTRIADLPSLVAVLAAERAARGDPFAERAGNMAGEHIGLIIDQFEPDPGVEMNSRLGRTEVGEACLSVVGEEGGR